MEGIGPGQSYRSDSGDRDSKIPMHTSGSLSDLSLALPYVNPARNRASSIVLYPGGTSSTISVPDRSESRGSDRIPNNQQQKEQQAPVEPCLSTPVLFPVLGPQEPLLVWATKTHGDPLEEEGTCAGLLSFASEEMHSFFMFFRILFWYNPFDMFLAWAVSAGSTCFFYFYKPSDSINQHLVFNLNWTMLSIALIFPLTMTITETFRRREQALNQLNNLKTNILSLFLAHSDWDFYSFPDKDRPVLSGRNDRDSKEGGRLKSQEPDHALKLLVVLEHFIDVLFTIMSAPRVSQAKHFYLTRGTKQRETVSSLKSGLDDCAITLIHDISKFGETFKRYGLPAGEKSRLTSFENAFLLAYIQLRSLKDYRSPAGLRAFARVFIIITPLVFGPYYALVAQSTSLSWSICMACITSSAMQGLFNIRHSLEDPFTTFNAGRSKAPDNPFFKLIAHFSDTIDMEVELRHLKKYLRLIQNNSSSEDEDMQKLLGGGVNRTGTSQVVATAP